MQIILSLRAHSYGKITFGRFLVIRKLKQVICFIFQKKRSDFLGSLVFYEGRTSQIFTQVRIILF